MNQPKPLLETWEIPAGAPCEPNRKCPRCEAVAARALEMNLPPPVVRDVESWVAMSRRYFAGRCRSCTDWDWSANWKSRYERAKGDAAALERLETERRRWTAKRQFCANARLRTSDEP